MRSADPEGGERWCKSTTEITVSAHRETQRCIPRKETGRKEEWTWSLSMIGGDSPLERRCATTASESRPDAEHCAASEQTTKAARVEIAPPLIHTVREQDQDRERAGPIP